MKSRIRLFTLLLALAVVFGLAVSVSAAETVDSGTCGENVTWTLDDGGTLTISGTGAMEDYASASASPWYSKRTSIYSVVMGSGVTTIGDRAFYNCTALTSVSIGEDVTTVGTYAFQGCTALKEVSIPAGVTELEASVFRACSALTTVRFSGNAPTVGNYAFDGCASNLTIRYTEGTTGFDAAPWTDYTLSTQHAGQWVVDVPVTCTTDGSRHIDCTYCNATFTETIYHTGHNYVDGICSGCQTVQVLYSGTCGSNITWELDARGILAISGTGAMRNYSYDNHSSRPWYNYCETIKSVVVEKGVTQIGDYAFYLCSSLTSVTIPNSVYTIGSSAFRECSSLTSITIPEGVTSIGDWAFGWCSSLTSITLPESVTSIGSSAFRDCSSLTSITIPEGVTSIGNYAFRDCSSLTSITIPDSVTSIGEDAFYKCSSLTSITLPESVTSIGNEAFEGCSSLTGIWVDQNNECYSSDGQGVLFNKAKTELIQAPGAISGAYAVPESVTSIGDEAFYYCTSLTGITIPGSVTSIGDYTFRDCSSLTSITIPESVTRIGDYTFRDCSSLTSITIPEGVTSIGWYAFRGCSSLTSITIPESVTSIGSSAFEGCSSLTSITIPEGVTSIGSYAFEDCSSLTSVTISEGVSSIGSGAFSYCRSLTSITLPESVTSIGHFAFRGCSSLTGITIPGSVTSIGDYAFSGCSSLTDIFITDLAAWVSISHDGWESLPTSANRLEKRLYLNGELLTDAVIPEGVTSIGKNAFYKCSSLTGITIPEGVTSIDDYAFSRCSSLTSITIPDSVTSIGECAFSGCSSLTSITIPESVTSIGNGAFEDCSSLTSITIPESVTSIGELAFEDCSSLTSITIPESVTSIGNGAFEDCSSLTEITFAGDAPSFGNYVFEYVIATAYYPADNATWTASKKQNHGGTITWIALGNLTGLELSNTFYAVGDDAVDVLAIYDNGVGRPLNPGTYTVSGLDFSTIGKKTVAVSYQGLTVEFDVYVHSGRGTVTVDPSLYPESAHNYGNNLDDVRIFRIPGASSITLTFSAATRFENSYDKLYLLDKNGNEISWYTGSQAAGITVTIPGDTVKLRLVTDSSSTYYGYSFSEIKAEQVFHVEETIMGMAPTCTESGISEGRYCSICNEVLIAQEEVAATGHTEVIDAAVDATCTTTGLTEGKHCSVCNEVLVAQQEIPATGHTEAIDAAVDATCTTTGLTEGKHCSVCNEVLVAQEEIPATGHTFDDDKDDTCNSCGYVREVNNLPVPAKPYKITNVVSGIHVYWKATEGAVKYGLWRSETGINGTYKWVANPTVPHFTDIKVESGKTYYYKVTTMDANGKHSGKSDAIGITYVSTPDITSRVNKAAGITLGWNKIEGATGYAIYRKSYSGSDAWVRVATISGNSTFTWTDTSVKNENGTAYKYTIRALAGSNMKTLSGCRNAGRSMVRLTSRTLRSAVKASATSIKCSWNTSAAVTSYEVRFMVDGKVYETFTIEDYKIGTKTFTGLEPGQTYKIQVRSHKRIDGMNFYSAWSAAKEVKL